MRMALILPLVLTTYLFAGCRPTPVEGGMGLAIATNHNILVAGDTLTLQVAITNAGGESVGFYARDVGNFALLAFDAQAEPLPSYTHLSWQRSMPTLYPDEYFLLASNQTWETKVSYLLRWGKIEDYLEARNKAQPGTATLIHSGYYIDPDHPDGPDHILIPGDHEGTIQLALRFSSSDPNPRGYDTTDCESAGIPVDVPDVATPSNRILQSVVAFDNMHSLTDTAPTDPLAWEEAWDLAMYCQQMTKLSQAFWIGALQSNRISIDIGG